MSYVVKTRIIERKVPGEFCNKEGIEDKLNIRDKWKNGMKIRER